ncbi:MAG: DUF2207 domain-containing protein, partial [Chloroflexi bacterium]
MRKNLAIVFLSAVILVFLSASQINAQTRSVFWQRWDVTIDNVDAVANRFDVSETHVVNFTGTFRFGSRVIPLTNLQSLENIQVFENGQPLQFGCNEAPGTFCARNSGSELSVTYYFRQPISNRVQTFEIAYTVVGAVRVYDGGDQIWWVAIPEDHFGFPIASSQITVHMPSGFGPREGVDPVETYGAPGDVRVQGSTITAKNTRQINGSEAFEIRVQFPHNESAVPPVWQSDFDSDREFEENVKPLIDLAAIGLGLFILLAGPLGVYALWYSRGRDPEIGPVPEYLSSPPSDLPPAVAGSLIDEQADVSDVMSTLIHLAHRGYLVMEEQQTEGIIFGLGKSNEFIFKRTDKPED